PRWTRGSRRPVPGAPAAGEPGIPPRRSGPAGRPRGPGRDRPGEKLWTGVETPGNQGTLGGAEPGATCLPPGPAAKSRTTAARDSQDGTPRGSRLWGGDLIPPP